MRFLKSILDLFKPATQNDNYANLPVVDEWTIVPLFFNLSRRRFFSERTNTPRKYYNVRSKVLRTTFKSESTISPYNLQEAANLIKKYMKAFPTSNQEDVVHYQLGVLPTWCDLLSLHVEEIKLIKALTIDINRVSSLERALIANGSYFSSLITIPAAYESELPNLFDIDFLRAWDKANEERKMIAQHLQAILKPDQPSNNRKHKI
jgi:hypothetical protein